MLFQIALTTAFLGGRKECYNKKKKTQVHKENQTKKIPFIKKESCIGQHHRHTSHKLKQKPRSFRLLLPSQALTYFHYSAGTSEHFLPFYRYQLQFTEKFKSFSNLLHAPHTKDLTFQSISSYIALDTWLEQNQLLVTSFNICKQLLQNRKGRRVSKQLSTDEENIYQINIPKKPVPYSFSKTDDKTTNFQGSSLCNLSS